MRYYLLFALVLCFVGMGQLQAQVPQAINYQGVVRDANGDPIVNSTVNVRFTIRESSPTGTVVLREIHSTASNAYGLISLSIGTGNVVQGLFGNINWASNAFYLEVEANDGTPTDRLIRLQALKPLP